MNVTEDTKKLGTEVSFNLHLPLFFHSPLQRFYHSGVYHSPGEEALHVISQCQRHEELSHNRANNALLSEPCERLLGPPKKSRWGTLIPASI